LYFAGEATHDGGFSGTVHGALATGLRAADEILGTRPARPRTASEAAERAAHRPAAPSLTSPPLP
jgi:hypothetical protein